jgi:hypothetical protein
MRRSALQAVALVCLVAGAAAAQGRVWPAKKNFITISDGVGTAAGGVLSGTTFMQVMRLSGVVTVKGEHGIDLTAVRMQTMFPPGGRLNDLEFSNPKGDALILSYAAMSSTRARGIPAELTIGGGVAKRRTSDPARTRETWIGSLGYDSDPFARWPHNDAGVGFHIYLMPASANNLVYTATLGLFFRIG